MVFNLESFIIKLVDHPLLETWYNHLTKSLSISFLTDFAINQSETTFLNFRISTISIVPINFRKFSHIWLNFSGIFCLEKSFKAAKIGKIKRRNFRTFYRTSDFSRNNPIYTFFETEFDCANLFSIQSNVAQKVLSWNRMVTFTMSQVHVQWSLLTVPLFIIFE